MGLDMYLNRRSYVKNWDYMGPQERHEITVKRGGDIRADIRPERISYVIEQVAYWRKANHIHKWFVDNIQNGEDDCGEYCVSRPQLQMLVDLCKQVLASVETVEGDVLDGQTWTSDGGVVDNTHKGQVVAQPAIAKQLLPTASGFFFGGTDYDEYYLEDIESTIEQIEPLLAIENDDADYIYHASW